MVNASHPQVLQALVIQHNNERTHRPRRQLLATKNFPDHLHRSVARESRKDQELVLMYCKASSSQHWHISESTWFPEVDYAQWSERAPTKKHTGHIDSWWFNREMVSNHSKNVGHGNNNLGQKMDSKCLERERKASMRKIIGRKLSANGGWVNNYFSRCTYVNVRIQFNHQWYKGKVKQSNTNIFLDDKLEYLVIVLQKISKCNGRYYKI